VGGGQSQVGNPPLQGNQKTTKRRRMTQVKDETAEPKW